MKGWVPREILQCLNKKAYLPLGLKLTDNTASACPSTDDVHLVTART